MLVLAIESSTSSAKALLFDDERGVIKTLSQPFGTTVAMDGMADTEQTFRLSLELAARAAKGADLAAIAVCGTWHSMGVLDDWMRPVTPMVYWNCMAARELCRQQRGNKRFTDDIFARTGCMPHVTYPRQTLLHYKQQGLRLDDKRLASQGAYNFYRMTGCFAESRSTASGSGFLNIATGKYDPLVLDMLGIDEACLGELVDYTSTRPLSPAIAEILGVKADIPVVPAHPDGALNQIASGAAKPGRMTVSIGTSAALRIVTEKAVIVPAHTLWCYYGVADWMLGAAIAGACNCVDWFVRDFAHGDYALGVPDDEKAPDALPLFLPFLFGERCPGWRDDRRAAFSGVGPRHGMAALFRAVQQGVLFNLYQCYEELVRASGEPEDIVVSGGILRDPYWTQMLADILGRGVRCSNNIDASTIGAAVLALRAAGGIKDIHDFDTEFQTAASVFPRPDMTAVYRERYAAYMKLYNSVGK